MPHPPAPDKPEKAPPPPAGNRGPSIFPRYVKIRPGFSTVWKKVFHGVENGCGGAGPGGPHRGIF